VCGLVGGDRLDVGADAGLVAGLLEGLRAVVGEALRVERVLEMLQDERKIEHRRVWKTSALPESVQQRTDVARGARGRGRVVGGLAALDGRARSASSEQSQGEEGARAEHGGPVLSKERAMGARADSCRVARENEDERMGSGERRDRKTCDPAWAEGLVR